MHSRYFINIFLKSQNSNQQPFSKMLVVRVQEKHCRRDANVIIENTIELSEVNL
jgi:hypothetical protein